MKRSAELVAHLARRELAAMHRTSALGVLWPLIRLGAQVAVLVFAFSTVLRLGIDDFPAFILCGLVAWTWFSAGISAAAGSVVQRRDLAFQPGFPLPVIPLVALAVPLADLLVALPVVLIVAAAYGELGWSALFLPLLIAIQLVLMAGIGWLTSTAHVYLRDVHSAVGVVLALLFYLTPVFYERGLAPEGWEDVLALNPMTVLVEAWRDVLLDGSLPPAAGLAGVTAAGLAASALGLWVFRRHQSRFVDEL